MDSIDKPHTHTSEEYCYNESTAGADASVEALKLYDMKLLTLAYLAQLSIILHCAKVGNDRPWSLLKGYKSIKLMAAAEQTSAALQLPIASFLVQS